MAIVPVGRRSTPAAPAQNFSNSGFQELTPTVSGRASSVVSHNPGSETVRVGYTTARPTGEPVDWLGYADFAPGDPMGTERALSAPVDFVAGTTLHVVALAQTAAGAFYAINSGSYGGPVNASVGPIFHDYRRPTTFDFDFAVGWLIPVEAQVDDTVAPGAPVTPPTLVEGPEPVGVTVTAPAGQVSGTPTPPASTGDLTGPTATVQVLAPAGDVDAFAVDRSTNLLTLTVLDAEVRSQPGRLSLALGNGAPGQRVYLAVDGVPNGPVDLDDLGGLSPVYVYISGLAAGPHTISVAETETATPVASAAFSTRTGATPAEPEPPAVLPPALTTTRWAFQSYGRNDAGTFDTYVLPRNPDQVSARFGELAITSEPVVSGGRVISWEGAQKPLLWTWTGRVLEQQEYLDLAYWGRENRRVYLTDHLSRRYLMAMASVTFERVRDPNRRWHHTYTMTGYALAGEGVLT